MPDGPRHRGQRRLCLVQGVVGAHADRSLEIGQKRNPDPLAGGNLLVDMLVNTRSLIGMACFGFPPDNPDLPRELPPRGSSDWHFLSREVLRAYERLNYRTKGERMMLVHPDDGEAMALVVLVDQGDFVSDELECPQVVTFQYRGVTFSLLEQPRPLRPKWP